MTPEGEESAVRAVAREEPEAVRAVAERAGDPLKSRLLAVLEEVGEGRR